MKVIITVKRVTTYSSIVEMDGHTFESLKSDLEYPGRTERQRAEREINRRIDTKDWQDDDFESVEEFEPLKEQ